MCGRYYIDPEIDVHEFQKIFTELNRKYANSDALAALKTGEIFPTNHVPILCGGNNELRPRIMQWGIPRWDGKGAIINARSETAAEKSTFRKSLIQRRCVVPTTGFYEWKVLEGQNRKQKYLFRLPDSKLLYLAGIYNEYSQPDGYAKSMFVILTTSANESMEDYHDRMPVIIRSQEIYEWTSGGAYGDLISRRPPSLVATSA